VRLLGWGPQQFQKISAPKNTARQIKFSSRWSARPIAHWAIRSRTSLTDPADLGHGRKAPQCHTDFHFVGQDCARWREIPLLIPFIWFKNDKGNVSQKPISQ
jgi:hypothetical protein